MTNEDLEHAGKEEAVGSEDNSHEELRAENEQLKAALLGISKGEGPFSRDPLTYAANCVDTIKADALAALEGVTQRETDKTRGSEG